MGKSWVRQCCRPIYSLHGIHVVAIFLLPPCGAGGYRAMLSIAAANLDVLYHDAFCHDLHFEVHCVLSGNF